MYSRAITRRPGSDFADGQTQANLGPPSYDLVRRQHQAYVDVLLDLDLIVVEMPPLYGYPDAYFVEDPAVVTPEVAIITIPGAPSRQGEEHSLELALSPYREVTRIHPPGTVDGGDILMVEDHFFIGVSQRTNAEGARQLAAILNDCGYTSTQVDVQNGLHLKSNVNYLGNSILLVTQEFAQRDDFDGFDKIELIPDESYAANTLRVSNCLLTPLGFPDTQKKLDRTGYDVIELDMSEVRKMDGGLTCLSLRF